MTNPVSEALSSTEAIRRAIAALGPEAEVPALVAYVRQHYGLGGADEFRTQDDVASAQPSTQTSGAPKPGAPASADDAPRKTPRKGRKD